MRYGKLHKIGKILLAFLVVIFITVLICIAYVIITRNGITLNQNHPYDRHLKDYSTELTEKEAFVQDFEFLYQEVKENYVNLEYKEKLLGFDWDEEYKVFQAKLDNSKGKKDFVKLCNEYIALLKDGHTWFGEYDCEPEERIWAPYSRGFSTGLQIRFLEGHPIVVANRLNEELNGYEVISINDIPFREILDTAITYSYRNGNDESAKTSLLRSNDYFQYFIYEYETLPDEFVINLSKPEGEVKTISFNTNITFQEDYYTSNKINFGIDESELPTYYIRDNLGYIRIDTFNSDVKEMTHTFDLIVKELKASKVSGVIIDVRNNGGGNESFRKILSYLTKEEINILQYRYRKSERYHDIFYFRYLWDMISSRESDLKSDQGYTKWRIWSVKPAKEQYLTTIPIAVICNDNIFSSTCDFVYACKQNKLAIVIGNMLPLSGHGLSTQVLLPSGNYVISYSFFESRDTKGNPIENVVVEPDVKIEQTYDDYIAGKDTILEEAFRVLDTK